MVEETIAVLVDPSNPMRIVLVGNLLPEEEKQELIEFLKQNLDVVVWTHEDMVGVDSAKSIHRLGVRTNVKPVKQKKKCFACSVPRLDFKCGSSREEEWEVEK